MIQPKEENRYITRQSLIYKTKVEYVKWAINHVKGCLHACKYCYAYMNAKRYGQVHNPEDWQNYKLVINALDLLDKEIPKLKDEIAQDFIHLCFTTDPFMFDASNNALVTDVKMLSLFIIKKLNDHGLRVETLTKGYYPQEVIDFNLSKKNYYGITVTSLDEVFCKYWEKYSAPPRLRIDRLKMLSLYGLKTWASIEPFPTPNIHNQDLDELLNSLSFVDKIVFGQMNYVPAATNYPKRKEFYENCVLTVVDFCFDNYIYLR